jgi:hypothetical protein
MNAWSVLGLLFGAAILATIPVSPEVTQRGVELRVDEAQAITYGRYRRVTRRAYRRAGYAAAAGLAAAAAGYYGAGYYGAPASYGAGYYGAPNYFGGYYGAGYYGAPGYGYYSRQPVGGGGGQYYCSGNDPRCWW